MNRNSQHTPSSIQIPQNQALSTPLTQHQSRTQCHTRPMPARRRPSIPILDGAASLSQPTDALPYWRITYRDHVTGKRRTTTGGTSRTEAVAKAAALLGIYSPSTAKSARHVAPTFTEVVTSWMNANQHRWSSRTPATYTYITAKYREALGDIPICLLYTSPSPRD